MDVTDVLRDRMHEPAGLQSMTAVSIAVHTVLVGFVCSARPVAGAQRADAADSHDDYARWWFGTADRRDDVHRRPAIQTETPPKRRQSANRCAPAAKVPEMTLPTPNARTVKAPNVRQAPDEARGARRHAVLR
jgi:hypothetical protein